MKLRLLAAFFVAVCCASRTFAVLTAADVQTVIAQAIARAAQISPNSVIAVTDREGDVLLLQDLAAELRRHRAVGEFGRVVAE